MISIKVLFHKIRFLLNQRKFRYYLFIGLIALYFLYHFFSGQRGIISFFKLSKQQTVLEQEIKNLENTKETLNKKIQSMQAKSLDLDLLDEKARQDLGLNKEGETVYHYE